VLVEYAGNVAGIEGAAHAEVNPDSETLVVAPLACSLVGETRVVRAVSGTRAAAICGEAPMAGYHFCSYGLAAEWTPALQEAGLVVSGYADDGTAEIVELPDHPFYVATLFQPQVEAEASNDAPLHPLLLAFAAAASQHRARRTVKHC
jgi:CTP synthase (UTP-ammonia lyase)